MDWDLWYILIGAPLLTVLFWFRIKNPILVALLSGLVLSLSLTAIGIGLMGVFDPFFLVTLLLFFVYGFAISSLVGAFLWWRAKRRGARE